MKLKLGKMKTKELCEWFSIHPTTYSHDRLKYLEKLEDYASFEVIYGGVIVNEIFIEEYDKKLSFKNDVLILKEAQEAIDGMTTMTGLAHKHSKQEKKSQSTLQKQFTNSRNRLFGATSTKKKIKKATGLAGSSELVWGIKLDDNGNYRDFTPAEEKLLDSIITLVYGNLDPQKVKDAALLDELFKTTNMTKEEYLEIKEEKGLNFFGEVIMRFGAETGLTMATPTKFKIMYNYELQGSEKQYRDILFKEAGIPIPEE